MVALIVSSLLVAMILSIFTSMSAAYRTQQQVAELQQVLQAADVTVEDDLRQAGFRCPLGFTWAGGGYTIVPPLLITDGGTGAQQPDQISIFYGDPSAQAQVVAATTALPAAGSTTDAFTTVNVDAIDPTWQVGDLVLFTAYDPTAMGSVSLDPAHPPEEATNGTSYSVPLPAYSACVLQISRLAGNTVSFSTTPPWGSPTNSHCNSPPTNPTYPAATMRARSNPTTMMLYKFVARAYRIDPTRKDLSVFQQSPSGGLIANDWTDLGLGFTNFQIASRWYEPTTGVDNNDTDTDPWRNWYSSGQQNALSLQSANFNVTAAQARSALQVSVSFVVRTTRHIVDGTVTAATPQLEDPANVDANDIGDSPSVTLAGVADASRPQELRGSNIYRYSTIKVDTRNLGNGR